MTQALQHATASAPASIGNVGVGYDVLGLAFDAVRDRVRVTRREDGEIRLTGVSGLVDALPEAVGENCALRAAAAVLAAADAPYGLDLEIEKHVPLSAGMGGSAASAVAAAGAVNALLGSPFPVEALLPFALEGERASADPPPIDNVMAALSGGLVIAARLDPPLTRRLPLADGLGCVLAHPDRRIETEAARRMLAPAVPHETAVEHSRHLAAFAAGCALGDERLIAAGLTDIFIEPQRLPLLPELAAVQAAARGAGALGCSFSGSGPSVFALGREADLPDIGRVMQTALLEAGAKADLYRAPFDSPGLIIEPAA
jgi:homoserine kinase